MRADLHNHTYFSDGTYSPEEIVEKAKANGVDIVAITDHNRIDAWQRFAMKSRIEGIIPIKGVEINAKYKNKIVHLLAYGFEDTERLLELIDHADCEMQLMSDHLVERLAKDDSRVSVRDFENYNYDPHKGGWKGMHYLFDRGITNRLFEAFSYYGKYKCDFEYYNFTDLAVLCEAIHEAGGYSVLAHPGSYFKNLSAEELTTELEQLRSMGLDGIECYYPTHSEALTKVCVTFCKVHHMLITVGGDDHGEFGKEVKELDQYLGCMPQTLEDLNIAPLLKGESLK